MEHGKTVSNMVSLRKDGRSHHHIIINTYVMYYEDGKLINKSTYICRFLNLTLCSFVVIHDINNDTWKREYINNVSFNCKNISIDYFSVTKVQNEIVDPFDTDTCNECSCKICNICKKCK